MNYDILFITEFVLQPRNIISAFIGEPGPTVARFERRVELPILPQPGLVFRGIAPTDIEAACLVYDTDRDQYIVEAKWGVCHAEGDCPCQQSIRSYLHDDRWTMMCLDVATEGEQSQGG